MNDRYFGVSQEKIWIHTKSFYEDLLYLLSQSNNPIEGIYIERLWCYMFTSNELFNLSLIDFFKTKYERIFKWYLSFTSNITDWLWIQVPAISSARKIAADCFNTIIFNK